MTSRRRFLWTGGLAVLTAPLLSSPADVGRRRSEANRPQPSEGAPRSDETVTGSTHFGRMKRAASLGQSVPFPES